MNSMDKQIKYDNTARIAAGICGVSDNLVRKVVRGDRDNEVVFTVFMELKEREAEAIEHVTSVYHELSKQAV